MAERHAETGIGARAGLPIPPRLPVLGTSSAYLMVQVAGEHGVPAERCLVGTGLSAADLEDARRTIRLEQEYAIARKLVRELAHVPALGLIVAGRYRLSVYGLLGLGMMCAPTLGQAVLFATRYLDLTYACCSMTSHRETGEYRLRIDGRRLPDDLRAFFMDRSAGAVLRLFGDLLPEGGWLLGVDLAWPATEHAGLYEREVGGPVTFGRGPVHEIRVDAAALDRALPQANEPMMRLIEEQCRRLLERRRAALTLADGLREFVLQELPALPSMADAAAALGMSERTVRRRLADEGTSFSAVVAGARCALAEELLLQGVPPFQVARRLGFAGPAAFTHAFKRWTGRAPRDFTLR
ncbi:AraC family transcriptional regulator [Spirillospora sp. CA-294931]|uniref:AraC family transcriptional regulator n=1 Tax=Spirillospora sp. CA-294931 TaxID=3240042 RepID=UPI003D91FFC7